MLNKDITKRVVQKLRALGCENYSAAVYAYIGPVRSLISLKINSEDIPEGLFDTWADMVVGRYLSDRMSTGKIGEILDIEAVAKSISEGDVRVEFNAGDSAEDRLGRYIDNLCSPPDNIFARYRRLVW